MEVNELLKGTLALASLIFAFSGSALAQRTDSLPPGGLAAKLDALKREYSLAEAEYYRPYQDAKTEEESAKIKLDPAKNPAKVFQARFLALAKEAGHTDAGFDTWMMVKQVADSVPEPKASEAAANVLIHNFADSPKLGQLALSLVYSFWDRKDRVSLIGRMLAKIENGSTYPEVKASAMYARATMLKDGPKADSARAKQLYDEILAKYPGTAPAKRAKGDLFEVENLIVGKTAPDFKAIDQDGVEFRLSDYRGKVVVLDFWGFWCGPCRALIPHNKEMVEANKSKPFALIGINSDGDRSVLQKIVKEQGLTYRNAVGGTTSGPIATAWNVHAWPTVYVIDANGVIRNKFIGVDAKVLSKAVDDLLKGMK